MSELSYDEYYACQLKVPRVGKKGQKKFRDAKCLIVGMGGLGCPVSLYLVGSGLGHLGICDFDRVDISNVSRQILYTPADEGKKKLDIAYKRLSAQNPFLNITLHSDRIDCNNWKDIISSYDLVIDCTDNFESKYLIHDACVFLKKDLIQAGVFHTSGQVYYFPFGSALTKVSCIRCVWEDIPAAELQVDCDEGGVLTALAGTVALRQVNIALLSILGNLPPRSKMHILDWEHMEWMSVDIPAREDCECRKEEHTMNPILQKSDFIDEVDELPHKDDDSLVILDTRDEKDHRTKKKFGNRAIVLLSDEERAHFESYINTLDKEKSYILVCYRGIRSLFLSKKMQLYGIKASSLKGGYKDLA